MNQSHEVDNNGNSPIATLANMIETIAQSDGDYATAIPGLSLHRRHRPTEPVHCIYTLGLGVVAQGGKQVMLGDALLDYGRGDCMLTTIDLPVISHITQARTKEPFLGLMLTMDARTVVQAASEMDLPPLQRNSTSHPITVASLDDSMIDALTRLVRLISEPLLAPKLAPLIKEEIIVRLLAGPLGSQLRNFLITESPSHQITKAIAWLKQHFAQTLQVEELAAYVHMSPSTFRQHFRAITGTSPLQFKKQLRLQEARQLMLNQNVDAGTASAFVGYESPSQFNREYHRLFGAPPRKDVKQLRQAGVMR